MRLKMNVLPLLAVSMLAASMAAQTAPDSAMTGVTPGAALPPKAAMVTMHVENMDAAPAKGAPFCATVTTEHTQLLADGNRIHTTDNSWLCRDSEGRTRREAGLNLLGAAPQTAAPKLITIVDPVAGVRYMLDTDNKVAHKMALSAGGTVAGGVSIAGPAGAPVRGERVMMYEGAGGSGPNVFFNNVLVKKSGQDSSEPAPATEKLGDQTIDGIHATGTRMTTTIPSGKLGNEKPIVVTSERWYSPELKVTVMTKHDDPWAGELKTQFSSVNTSEPDPSLFSVPGDYKIVEDKPGPFTIQLPPPGPPGQ